MPTPVSRRRRSWRSWTGAPRACRTTWRNEETRKRIDAGSNHNAPYQDTSSAAFIDPRTLSKAVDAILPTDRVVASDSGHFCGWVPRFLRVPNARASCLSHSFQSVGLGLASAIGLAIANPGALAVLGAGDGGFLMSLADLETAIRLKLRMCILVYNDSSYAAEVHLYRRRGYGIDIVQFPDTDFAAIARGHGARAATVRTIADLEPVRDLGARGRARRLPHRRQDQSRPRGRLARRALPVTAGGWSVFAARAAVRRPVGSYGECGRRSLEVAPRAAINANIRASAIRSASHDAT